MRSCGRRWRARWSPARTSQPAARGSSAATRCFPLAGAPCKRTACGRWGSTDAAKRAELSERHAASSTMRACRRCTTTHLHQNVCRVCIKRLQKCVEVCILRAHGDDCFEDASCAAILQSRVLRRKRRVSERSFECIRTLCSPEQRVNALLSLGKGRLTSSCRRRIEIMSGTSYDLMQIPTTEYQQSENEEIFNQTRKHYTNVFGATVVSRLTSLARHFVSHLPVRRRREPPLQLPPFCENFNRFRFCEHSTKRGSSKRRRFGSFLYIDSRRTSPMHASFLLLIRNLSGAVLR